MSPNLALAIRINVEIREVVDAARQVNYVALNALLTARKAGTRSLGFAVVARELRSLSHDMEQTMQSLDMTVGNLVRAIAAQLREAKQLAAINAAGAACATPPACVLRMQSSLAGRMAVWQERIDQEWHSLGQVFARATRLSEMGGILARSAKIEAAHGGDMAVLLILVSRQMEDNVGAVVVRLRELRQLIAPQGRAS